jgi:hypothetical protein
MTRSEQIHDEAWRADRARRGGQAARSAFEEARRERGDRYPTKGDAYAAGYRLGYLIAQRVERRRRRTQVIHETLK